MDEAGSVQKNKQRFVFVKPRNETRAGFCWPSKCSVAQVLISLLAPRRLGSPVDEDHAAGLPAPSLGVGQP